MGGVIDAISDILSTVVDIVSDIVDVIATAIKSIWSGIVMPILEFIFGLLGFTDEEIYTVQVTTQQLIPDDQANSLTIAVLRAISTPGDIIENIKLAVLAGPVVGVQRYQQYGESTYINGLPTTKTSFKAINLASVKSVLDNIYGESITISLGTLGPAPDDYWIKYYLQQNENYSESIGIIYKETIPWIYDYFVEDVVTGNFTIYLKRNLVINRNITIPKITIILRVRPTVISTPIIGAISTTKNKLVIKTYPVAILATHEIYDTLGYLIAGASSNVFYNIKFYLDSAPVSFLYWEYQRSLGTYPTLDAASPTGTDNTKMLPIVPVREDFISITSGNPSYITSKKILEIIGINYDDIITSIEDNPDIDQIEDAFILFAINLYTKTKPGLKVLYVMWYNFFLHASVSKADYNAVPIGGEKVFNTISVEEGTYNTNIIYNYITQANIVGVIGTIGTYTSQFVVLPNDADIDGGGVNSYALFRWQYDTNNYSELKVHGLFMVVAILTTINTFKTNIVEISTLQADMDNFVLPLSYTMFDGFDYIEKEKLIYQSFTMVIYSSDSIYLEWYETPAFASILSFVLQVVSIVLLFFSLGSSSSLSSTLWAIARQLLIAYALQLVLQELLIQAGDNDDARIAAIIAYAIASFYSTGGEGDMPLAETLLQLARVSTEAINIYVAIQAEDLAKEMASWTIDSEARQQEIDDARDGLAFGKDSDIDFYEITQMQPIDPYMTPTQYYNLYAHSGNIGVQTLEQIKTYVDDKLILPQKVLGLEDTTTAQVNGLAEDASSNEN